MRFKIKWLDNLLSKEYKSKFLKKERAFRKKYFQYINELRVIRKLPNE